MFNIWKIYPLFNVEPDVEPFVVIDLSHSAEAYSFINARVRIYICPNEKHFAPRQAFKQVTQKYLEFCISRKLNVGNSFFSILKRSKLAARILVQMSYAHSVVNMQYSHASPAFQILLNLLNCGATT